MFENHIKFTLGVSHCFPFQRIYYYVYIIVQLKCHFWNLQQGNIASFDLTYNKFVRHLEFFELKSVGMLNTVISYR